MSLRFQFSIAAFAAALLLCAGCASHAPDSPGFGNVSPADGEKDVSTIPTFSWKVEDGLSDVYFQLYPANAYDFVKNKPTGQPLLQLSGFSPGRHTVSLQNDAMLKSRYQAVGPFVDEGLSTLNYGCDYVWLLIATKNGTMYHSAFRFRTIEKWTG
jgi:hypothetical protein